MAGFNYSFEMAFDGTDPQGGEM